MTGLVTRCERVTAILLAGMVLTGIAAAQVPLGTSFTYQGFIKDVNGPISGPVQVQFRLFAAASGGTAIASSPVMNASADEGLFSTQIDFGSSAFNGDARWLEIVVDGVTLSPRQRIAPAPYALKVPGVDGHSLDAADRDPLDAVFVNGAGWVGIGTTAPEMSLEVTVPSSFHGRPVLGVSFADHYLYLHGSAEHSLIWNDDAPLRFGTETSRSSGYVERMRITGDGKVGIGTTTPEFPLHCVGSMKIEDGALFFSGTTSAILSLRCAGAGGLDWRLISTNATAEGGAGQFWLQSPTAGRALRIQPDGTMSLGIPASVVLTPGGQVGIGTSSPQAKLDVAGETRTQVLRITGGADLAEPFDVNGDVAPQPGFLVAIDPKEDGKLVVTSSAYDRTVAGVLSGANQINPGMILAQEGSIADGKHPVALTGRVYVWCDADAGGPIQPGDLLTSSPTAGHAMKAAELSRAPGATIGKAMSTLDGGKGLVLVLVSLQ